MSRSTSKFMLTSLYGFCCAGVEVGLPMLVVDGVSPAVLLALVLVTPVV